MITVYAGLWYLTGDVGNETKIFLFIVIIFSNAFFGIIWITSYLGHVDWAVSLVKNCRTESQYIEIENLIPYFPECLGVVAPPDKTIFLRDTLLGHQFYSTDLTYKKMQELMTKRYCLIQQIYKDIKNIEIQK